MELQAYRQYIATPISDDNPIGHKLEDDETLDFIESQLMKVGSLSHGDIQWETTEQKAFELLRHKSKDLKVLTHLLQCLQHQTTVDRLLLSAFVLADFISLYWEECYPAPGAKGVRYRQRFFAQIVQRTENAAEKLEGAELESAKLSTLFDAFEELRIASENRELPTDDIEGIASMLKRKFTLKDESEPVETDVVKAPTPSSSNTVSTAKLDIDTTSERAIKQTLLNIAEVVGELAGGLPLSLRLRRFAVWFSITSAPDADAEGETALMPVSPDRVSEYNDQITKGPNKELWRKVEQSLAVSPFWIDGHRLSNKIALALGEKESAQAIASEASGFLRRLPAIAERKFKGGTPFVSDETQRWLAEAENAASNSAKTGSDWDSKRKEAFQLAKERGLSEALEMLNEGLSGSKEPRDQFYYRMLSADVLSKHQLTAIASQQYSNLLAEAQQTALSDWEPRLIKQLENQSK